MLYPFLLALAWALNQGLSTEAEWSDLLRPTLVVTLVVALLVGLGWLVMRNRWDGSLLACGLILLVILPFPAFKLWQTLGPTVGFVALVVAMTALLGIPAALAARSRRRGQPMPRPRPSVLNAFAALLFLSVLVSSAVGDAQRAFSQWFARPEPVELGEHPARPPDMVVVLLDGYPRSDVLGRRLGIDNTPFLADLERRGFDVAAGSNSNYVLTALSLASMFQMQYLDSVASVESLVGTPEHFHDLLRDAATDGAAFRAIKEAGYQVVTADPGWDHVSLAGASDEVLDDGQLSDLERSLLEQTWLMDVIGAVAPAALTEQLRDRMVYEFDALDAFASEEAPAPRFLFLHVPGPHPPIVVDAEGGTVPVGPRQLSARSAEELGVTTDEFRALLTGELDYLHQRVLASVDRLQRADPSAVIVVMADHGYTQEVREDDPDARFANLFAAYTPGAPGLLADGPTPVNLFPRLLNKYLGADIPTRPDRYFLSPGPLRPMVLTEVPNPTASP